MKIIHESRPGRYVVEVKLSSESAWEPWESHDRQVEATLRSDTLATMNPGERYRVVDTATA